MENIIEVYKLYIDSNAGYVYLVMEYFEGIEMFKHIQSIGIYSGNSSLTYRGSCETFGSSVVQRNKVPSFSWRSS